MLISSYNDIHKQPLTGLTKLAKLDFLVRYPVFLERLSETVLDRHLPDAVKPTALELYSVESRMVRYKYGPWDDRYYPILGTLIGLGLVEPATGERTLTLRVTSVGRSIAESLSSHRTWSTIVSRCAFVNSNFNLTGNRLKEVIYNNLPIITAVPHRKEI